MNKVSVYLAGGIRGTPNEMAYDIGWRKYVSDALNFPTNQLTIYNPMTSESVDGRGVWKLFGDFKSTPNAILHKDVATLSQSDIIFMNLTAFGSSFYSELGGRRKYHIEQDGLAKRIEGEMFGDHPHVGTFIELGLVIAYRKLLVVVTPDSYLAEYPMILSAATAIVPTVERGVDFTRGLIKTLLGE
jgi:hypothetical protein